MQPAILYLEGLFIVACVLDLTDVKHSLQLQQLQKCLVLFMLLPEPFVML